MYMNLNFRSLICVFYNFVLKCDISIIVPIT